MLAGCGLTGSPRASEERRRLNGLLRVRLWALHSTIRRGQFRRPVVVLGHTVHPRSVGAAVSYGDNSLARPMPLWQEGVSFTRVAVGGILTVRPRSDVTACRHLYSYANVSSVCSVGALQNQKWEASSSRSGRTAAAAAAASPHVNSNSASQGSSG